MQAHMHEQVYARMHTHVLEHNNLAIFSFFYSTQIILCNFWLMKDLLLVNLVIIPHLMTNTTTLSQLDLQKAIVKN